jgi:aryl-alcohol dehydrogenase-like predicted oxidoreductase
MSTPAGATRTLGNGGPELSLVGLGAWAIGGPWLHGWGPQDDDLSIRAIHRALDEGYNWIDTAAVYGLGHSEEVVGRAVAGRRDRALIATKCINRWRDDRSVFQSGRAASVREECENSLRRLGVDHIDLYQIHGPTPDAPVEETWGAMCDLQDQGKVRWIGVSNYDVEKLRACAAIRTPQSLQPGYSVINRGVEDQILPYCQEMGIGVVPYGTMAEGILSGSFDIGRVAADDIRRSEHFRPVVERGLEVVELLRPLAERRGLSVGQLCIAWAMEHPAVTSVIVGVRNPDQAVQNILPAEVERSGIRDEVDAALAPGVGAGAK